MVKNNLLTYVRVLNRLVGEPRESYLTGSIEESKGRTMGWPEARANPSYDGEEDGRLALMW
jgi:hypothetical protein